MDVNAPSAPHRNHPKGDYVPNIYGIKRITTDELPVSVVISAISKLESKTDMFRYIDPLDFFNDVMDGKYIIWMNDTVAAFGLPVMYKTGHKELSLTIANYSDNEYTAKRAQINILAAEEYAKENGFNTIKLDGRAGWKKIYKDYDFSSLIMVKELG